MGVDRIYGTPCKSYVLCSVSSLDKYNGVLRSVELPQSFFVWILTSASSAALSKQEWEPRQNKPSRDSQRLVWPVRCFGHFHVLSVSCGFGVNFRVFVCFLVHYRVDIVGFSFVPQCQILLIVLDCVMSLVLNASEVHLAVTKSSPWLPNQGQLLFSIKSVKDLLPTLWCRVHPLDWP